MNPRVSVVICTADRTKLAAVQAMYRRVLDDVPHEILAVEGASSMCLGYNEGLKAAKGEVVLFSHDDVEVLSGGLGEKLTRHLSEYDVVGIAGTDRLVHPMWSAAGPPHLFGQVAHANADGSFTVEIFTLPTSVAGGMQAMDGVFLAARRDVAVSVGWDAENFTGWHCYDADFVFRAHLSGRRLGVVGDIPLIHHSRGNMGDEWRRYAEIFLRKFAGRLPPFRPRQFTICQVLAADRNDALSIMAPHRSNLFAMRSNNATP